MRSHPRLVLGALALGAIGCAATACNLLLGDHQIFGEDRTSCSDDADCADDERCGADFCRERCDKRADAGTSQCLQEGITGFRHCTDDEACTEPIGSWCDYDLLAGDEYCGGYAGSVQCTNEDADGDETRGYCTAECRGSEGDPLRCPTGFQCVGYVCRCIKGVGCP